MEQGSKKRGSWTQDALTKAINEVKEKRLSVHVASRRHAVPRRTLCRYLAIGKSVKLKLGCKPTLSAEQEKELCTRIFRLCDVGYPLTSKILQLNVWRYCSENGISNKFLKGKAGRWWLQGFMNRNPEVTRRKAQRLNPARAQKLNAFIVEDHFQKLKKILIDKNLLDFPEKIFNMDEKGCRLHLHKDPSVFARKGSKRVHIVAKEHGETVSVVACGNACGSVIPPMLLFKGVRKNPAWEKNLPPGSHIMMTPKGSMTVDAFVEFIKHVVRFKPQGKCLLIFDGAKAHLDYTICEVAEDNDILLYCLPSNTTHELQPLDKGCFRSFEIFWDNHALLYFDTHKDENDISKLNFGDVFTPTWEKSMTHINLKSGFRSTGVFPFNPLIIPEEAFAPSTVTEQPIPEQGIVDEIPPNPDLDISTPGTSSMFQPNAFHVTSKTGQCKRRRSPRIPSISCHSDSFEDVSFQSTNSSNKCDLDEPENSPASNSSAKLSTRMSFNELLASPKRKRKTTRKMKPAINSRGLLLKKQMFKNKLIKTRNADETNKSSSKVVKKQATASKKSENCTQYKRKGKASGKKTLKHTESWYCDVCCEDEVLDMRRCAVCGTYVHEQCVGLTKKDKQLFICPDCQV